jgi:hypothetical protein
MNVTGPHDHGGAYRGIRLPGGQPGTSPGTGYCDDKQVQDGVGEVELSAQDLRVVARYAAECAQEVLPIFEEIHPGDRRPRAAVEAAWIFAEGASRTKLQRTSALAAHKAAQETTSEAARDAACSDIFQLGALAVPIGALVI